MTTDLGTTITYFVGAHYEVVVTGTGTQRIAMRTNGTLSFLIGDHLGSTSLATDAAGTVVSQQYYTAWGEVRYASGTMPTKYTYTGQYSHTADFGLMFFNARWYDSSLSRFVQADDIIPESTQGVQAWDRYAYVSNSPVRYIDPTGHKGDDGCGAYGCGKNLLQYRQIASYTKNITELSIERKSLATKINSNTVLTHNHSDYPDVLKRINGQPQPFPSYANPVGPKLVEENGEGKAQTTLITFDANISGNSAPLASQATIKALKEGDKVQVAYWDDAREKIAVTTMSVNKEVENGRMLINDPNRIINPGDSGGGVFYNGQLIGNIWSRDRKGPGGFTVATIPSAEYLSNTSVATTETWK